jgi:hypothetical protein
MKTWITLLARTACLLIVLSATNGVYAQSIPTDTTVVVELETTDGNTFIGRVVKIDDDKIVLRSNNLGDLNIPRRNIRNITPIDQKKMVAGNYWYDSPIDVRYFFNSNAYGIRKGEGYYQNTWVFLNQVAYGVTNNITIGGGFIPLFLFGGSPTPVWATVKGSIPIKKDKFNLGVGGLFATVIGEEDASFGILYGNATVGSRDRNFNIGLGYGYAGGDWASTPAINFSGIYRTSKSFALITENYLVDAGDSNAFVGGLGVRFIGKKVVIDGALVIPYSELGDYFFALPWLGVTFPFGTKKQYIKE